MKSDIIEDMSLTELAWQNMKVFVEGLRKRQGEENFVAFERLYNKLTKQL